MRRVATNPWINGSIFALQVRGGQSDPNQKSNFEKIGRITAEMYDKKLKEYKSKQSDLLLQMQEHSVADEEYHLTASRLLDLCKRAFEIFESSEPLEKRVFLNFILQNSVLNAKKPVFTLKPVFAGIVKAHDTKKWLAGLDDVRTILKMSLI